MRLHPTIFLLCLICFAGAQASPDYHAVVDQTCSGEPGNIVDSAPRYGTIGAALRAIPPDNSDPFIVTVSGYQDTLFVNAGRSYFENCRILGHVDFIFGAGRAVFDRCEIVSRNRAGKDPTGYVTAPSTPISYPYGLLFVDSRFVRETSDVPAGTVRLGRPWHPGADLSAVGSAVFVRCFMDDHIGAKGYAPISSRNEQGERIWFEREPHSRFFEYASHGPGALDSPSRPVLDERAAAWYTPGQVLNGWAPGD